MDLLELLTRVSIVCLAVLKVGCCQLEIGNEQEKVIQSEVKADVSKGREDEEETQRSKARQ